MCVPLSDALAIGISLRGNDIKWKRFVCVQLLQLCPTLCDPMDCSLPHSPVHRILQARILEWVPFPPPRNLPDPGFEPMSPASPELQVASLPLSYQGSPVTTTTIYQLCKFEAS